MKSYTHILLLLASLLGLGCPGPEEVPTYYVSQEMLRYCWFPDGSYWIYELEGSPGVFDSVYSSNASNAVFQDDGDEYYTESYGFTLQILNNQRSFTAIAWPVGLEGDNTLTQMTEIYSDSFVSQVDYVLFWDSRGRDTMGSAASVFRIHHDSIIVGGKTYYDAIEVTANPPLSADWTYNTLWARNIGMIRRSTLDGSNWSLVRHHIN